MNVYKVIPKAEANQKQVKVVEDFLKLVNSLPGIKFSNYSDYGQSPISLFFDVDNTPEAYNSLFIITRSSDRRYWKYGNQWSINLSVYDVMSPFKLPPISYCLASKKDISDETIEQLSSLIENIHYTLNHKNFIKCFNLEEYIKKLNLQQ